MDALISGLLGAALDAATAAADRYGALLAVAALKGSVLLGAAALATRAMRRASAASRHLVWSATVAAVLALPLIEAAGPRWTLPIVPASLRRLLPAAPHATRAPHAEDVVVVHTPPSHVAHAAHAAHAAYAAVSVDVTPVASAAPTTVVVETVATPAGRALPALAPLAAVEVHASRGASARGASARGASARGPSLLGWAMLVWAAGAGLVLLRLALGTVGLARLVRRARPADDAAWVMLAQRLARELGIRRPVTLLVGRTGTVPVTWGVVYPIVLLPADADAWSEERRRAVLLHELAHVERFDALTQVVSQLALAVFWFNPLVALAARRLRAERERACDDVVLAVGTLPTDYAGDLLELVQTLGETGPAAAALAMARRSEFEGRLLAILDPAVPRSRTSRRATLGATLCAAAAVVPLAAMRAAPAADETTVAVAVAEPPADVHPADAPAGPTAPDAPALAPLASLDTLRGLARDTTRALDTLRGLARDTTRALGLGMVDTALLSARRSGRPDSLGARGFESGVAALAQRVAALTGSVAARADSLVAVARGLGDVTADGCGPIRGRYYVAGEGPGRTIRVVDDEHCVEVHAVGAVEFTDDHADVRAVARGARLVVTETRDGVTRRMLVDDAARTFLVGGVERPLAEGNAWLRRTLPSGIRDAGFDADVRVERLRREGGVAAVLDAVRRQTSDGTKRRYLERLLASSPALDDAALRDVAVAARGMVSDGDKGAVLRATARRGGASPAVGVAVLGGVPAIVSDGEKRRVLEQTLQPPQASLAVLTLAAQSARAILSDGDRAAVLRLIAPRVGESAALRAAFFASTDAIVSGSERRAVLVEVLAHAADDSTVAAALVSAQGMLGESERAAVLVAASTARSLGAPRVRDAYFRAAGSMLSESAREAAVTAALRARPDDLAVAVAAVGVASAMTSERAKANLLLEAATRSPILTDEQGRAALIAAIRTLGSGAEYRRVMDAVIR